MYSARNLLEFGSNLLKFCPNAPMHEFCRFFCRHYPQKPSIAPLSQRYALKCYIVAYKCANSLSPSLLVNRFELNSRPSNRTRQTSFTTFTLPLVSTKIGLNSLSFIAADRFNGLSVDLRSAPNLAMFVSLLKDDIGYPKKEGHRACGVSLLK